MTLEEQIAKANEAYDKAVTDYDTLGKDYTKKTTASDDIKTLSGWSDKPTGFSDVPPEKVKSYSGEIGHNPKRAGAMDQVNNGGFEGKYNSSHAEKQVLTEKPNEPTGVSRPMCSDCQSFASKQAQSTGKDVVVADPDGTHIFHADGTKDFIPR